MKNKIVDLNNHLFAQLERLGDESLTPAQLEHEVKRAGAIVGVAEQLVRSATVTLKAAELAGQYGEIPRGNLSLLDGRVGAPAIEDKLQ